MILNYTQINSAITKLTTVQNEQLAITEDAENVVVTQLSAVWESPAQEAYQETFCALRDRALTQINNLINLFRLAAEQSKQGLYQVDVDLATMNCTAIIND